MQSLGLIDSIARKVTNPGGPGSVVPFSHNLAFLLLLLLGSSGRGVLSKQRKSVKEREKCRKEENFMVVEIGAKTSYSRLIAL